MPTDVSTRAALLAMLTRGLITPSEAADIAGVTRQAVNQWLRVYGIDPARARAEHLVALYDRLLEQQ